MQASRVIAIIGIAVLLILHNDWWNWQPKTFSLFGVLPFDLVYHLLWTVAAYYLGLNFSTFGIFPVFPCLVIESITTVIVSLITNPPPKDVVARFENPFGGDEP